MTDNSHVMQTAATPREMEYFRPTSLQLFEQCPESWRQQYILNNQQGDSKWSAIGTAAHSVIEAFLNDHVLIKNGRQPNGPNPGGFEHAVEQAQPIVGAEMENLFTYITHLSTLLENGWDVMAIEHKWRLPFSEGMPPLQGTIDLLLWHGASSTIMIVDHKTNRRHEGSAEWKKKLQPLIYGWAVRQMYPGYPVMFAIGHVNIGYHATWTVTDELVAEAEARLSNIYQELLAISTGEARYKAEVSDSCRFCPIKKSCTVAMNTVSTVGETYAAQYAMMSPVQRLDFLDKVEKLVKSLKDEASSELVSLIRSSSSSTYSEGGLEYYEEAGKKRQASALDVDDVINDYFSELGRQSGMECDEQLHRFRGMMDDLFTVKVTGLDKLKTKLPELHKALVATVKQVESSTKSVKSRLAERAIEQ